MRLGRSWQPLSVCLFTIDDTGCPTSQSVSPSKTPSGSEQSARGSPTLPERAKAKVKRVRVMTEWSGEPRSSQRHKRELRSAMKARGKGQGARPQKFFSLIKRGAGSTASVVENVSHTCVTLMSIDIRLNQRFPTVESMHTSYRHLTSNGQTFSHKNSNQRHKYRK